jgi:hypothetical protein
MTVAIMLCPVVQYNSVITTDRVTVMQYFFKFPQPDLPRREERFLHPLGLVQQLYELVV